MNTWLKTSQLNAVYGAHYYSALRNKATKGCLVIRNINKKIERRGSLGIWKKKMKTFLSNVGKIETFSCSLPYGYIMYGLFSHCLYLVLNTQETSHFYWQYFHTLWSQIKGYTRLLIFRKFSILPAVIWASPFINFQENF